MIKLMIHIVKIVMATIVALLFGACNFEVSGSQKNIKGSGHVVSEERKVDDFTKIEVKKGLDCEVIQTDEFKVVVIADDNLQEGITTQVENGTLVISSKYNNYSNVKSKTIQVMLPMVTGLEANSGATLRTKGDIRSNNISLKSSSAANIIANVESEKITLDASSGSDIKIKGKAMMVDISSSSGSSINAKGLLANDINADSSSGSDISVHPILALNAQASSGSTIEYVKTPKKINIQESSGGDVSFN